MDDDSIWGMGKCSKSLNLKPRLGDLRCKSRQCIMKFEKYLVGLSFSVSGRFAPKVYLGNWPSVLLQLKTTWTTTVYKLTLQALQALLLHQGAWKEMHYQALLTSSSSATALDGIGLALSSVSRTSGRFSARWVEFWNLHGEPGPCSALYKEKKSHISGYPRMHRSAFVTIFASKLEMPVPDKLSEFEVTSRHGILVKILDVQPVSKN